MRGYQPLGVAFEPAGRSIWIVLLGALLIDRRCSYPRIGTSEIALIIESSLVNTGPPREVIPHRISYIEG